MVEEMEKQEIEQNQNDVVKVRAHNETDRDDLEEGEIAGNDDVSASTKALEAVMHPLEHSWTFWFDNPSAKSRQAAWGSSMRPIYTFSHVEVFWRYFVFSINEIISINELFRCFYVSYSQ